MTREKEVILVKEPLWSSVIKDTYTIGSLLSAVGVGIWIDSGALQWTAGILWILWVLGRATRFRKDNTYTVSGARAKLDQIEADHPTKEGN